jgi:hypothetical protein
MLNTLTIDRDDLVKHLKEGVVTITFTKADGSERVINATLDPNKLPLMENNPNKPKRAMMFNPDVVKVYDTDKAAWRSFRLDSIIDIKGFNLLWNKYLVAE